MLVGRRMIPCFNSHFSCGPKRSNVFKTNTAGQQNFSERLFLEAIFTDATNAFAEKGLNWFKNWEYYPHHQPQHHHYRHCRRHYCRQHHLRRPRLYRLIISTFASFLLASDLVTIYNPDKSTLLSRTICNTGVPSMDHLAFPSVCCNSSWETKALLCDA